MTEHGQEHTLSTDTRVPVFDFFDNRAAAMVYIDGALRIDCGTADFAKYAEAAYRSPWELAVEDGKERVSLIPGLGAELYLPIDEDDGGVARERDGGVRIQFRARAAKKGQLVSVFLNEARLGDVPMPGDEWKSYSIAAPADAIAVGENKLRFYFRHAGEIAGQHTAAAFSRIAVGRASPDRLRVGVRAEATTRGGLRMSALTVPGQARLSYTLRVPTQRPELLFAVAGKGAEAKVQIAGASSGGAAAVWQGTAGSEWGEQRVDLSAHAGEVTRIDFVSSGEVSWGRPQLLAGEAPARGGGGDDAQTDDQRKPADHVIVWVVASLRDDRFAGREVPTPAFARFAEHGIRFTSLTSASPSPGPAHVALLTGAYPRGRRIGPRAHTIAERFRQAGFATAMISGNGFINDEDGFSKGFDTYINPLRERQPYGARILWQKARRVLSRHKDGHAFIYVATSEPHLPYTPSEESLAAEWSGPPARFEPAMTARISEDLRAGKEHLTREEQAYVKALYNAEVRDANAAFATMLADLAKLGVADRTAIVVVGDHGEELFERGYFGHGSDLYQEVLHVPLVVAPAGMSAGMTVDTDVELVDVYATTLDLAGIAVDPASQGRSLLPLADPRHPDAVWARLMPNPTGAELLNWGRALKLGRYKFIVPLRGPHELFDLERDPGEVDNLMGSVPLVERYVRNVFGIAMTYRNVWSRRRWGPPDAVTAAFAADQGL